MPEPELKSHEPRVAFLPDSFFEVNGVAHTARQFTAWAGRTGRPFLAIRGGKTLRFERHGALETLELPRGAASFALDRDLRYDIFFVRHGRRVLRTLRAFRPDIVHITGPSELGMLGALCAYRMGVPLAASWHTNVHQYAAQRSARMLGVLPLSRRAAAAAAIERAALAATARFYALAKVLFAPNPELCRLLEASTGRACSVMPRGIDAEMFHPRNRTAPPPAESGVWTLGYVGRLSVEKNVALLVRVASELRARGMRRFRFLIVGQGAEERLLRLELPEAEFAGVLRGDALAAAYANMDCFLFPSHTDTFGNVVLEAMASGVPVVVTPDGGPAHLVRSSAGGGVVAADEHFAEAVEEVLRDPQSYAAMRVLARAYAERQSWDAVFEGVYRDYAGAEEGAVGHT